MNDSIIPVIGENIAFIGDKTGKGEQEDKTIDLVLFILACLIPPVMWYFVCCHQPSSGLGRSLKTFATVWMIVQLVVIVGLIIAQAMLMDA
jgi:hypothetical protein